MARIIGASAGAPVKTGDKFRAVWSLNLTAILPGTAVDAAQIARTIQEALPSLGFYTVSNLSAVRGDAVVLWDVRSTPRFTGHTVADVAEALDKLPAFRGGLATSLQSLTVLALSGVSAEQLLQDAEAAKSAGNKEAESSNLFQGLLDVLKKVGVVALVAGAVVLFVVLRDPRATERLEF